MPKENYINWRSIEKVRLLDEDGKTQLGFFSGSEALNIAQERGLDLINVSLNATPPVCRIIDVGKFKYEQQRKQKKQKSKTATKQKQMIFTINISENDLETKIKKVIEFLKRKNAVKLIIQLKGRDQYRKDDAIELMQNIRQKLSLYAKYIGDPVINGRNVVSECR